MNKHQWAVTVESTPADFKRVFFIEAETALEAVTTLYPEDCIVKIGLSHFRLLSGTMYTIVIKVEPLEDRHMLDTYIVVQS